jgi:acyl-coenzyme A thioesterase PaaI-like protein
VTGTGHGTGTGTGHGRAEIGGDKRMFLPMTTTEQPARPGDLPVLVGELPDLAFLTDGSGHPTTGVLASAIDSIGGLACGLAVLPGWIVTTNLTLRRAPSALTGRQGTGPLTLRAQVMRRGRSAAVARVSTNDADGIEVATGWVTSAVLDPEEGPPVLERPFRRTILPMTEDPAAAPRLEEYFGLQPGSAPGEGWLDITAERRNSWGILFGGGVAVLIDAAATSAAAGIPVGRPAPDHVVTDLLIHYLSPGRVGPVVATTERLGAHGRDEMVKVELRDTGADDRPLTTAVATVRRPARPV